MVFFFQERQWQGARRGRGAEATPQPKPYMLTVEPQTPNPKPQTPNLKLETLKFLTPKFLYFLNSGELYRKIPKILNSRNAKPWNAEPLQVARAEKERQWEEERRARDVDDAEQRGARALDGAQTVRDSEVSLPLSRNHCL